MIKAGSVGRRVMRRFTRIVRRVALIVLAVLVLLIGAAVVFARTETAHAMLRDEVTRLLREELGLDATFDQVEIELVPPRAHVLRVVVDGADDRPLVTVDRITVAVQLASLLLGSVEVSEITLEEPEVNLVIEGGRVVNLPDLRQGGGSSGGGQEIGDLGVLAGRVRLEVRDAPGGSVRVELNDVNADLTIDGDGTTEVRLLISGGSVTQGAHRHAVSLIQGRVVRRGEVVLLRNVRAHIDDLRVDLPSATVGLSAPNDVVGNVEVWLPLELVRELPLPVPTLQGNVHATVAVTRRNGRLEAAGDLELNGLIIGPEFSGPHYTYGPHAIGDIRARFRYQPERVEVSEASIDRPAEDGVLVARNLTVDLADERLPMSAEIELIGVDLGHIIIDAGLYASRVRGAISGHTTLQAHLLGGMRLRFLPVSLQLRDFAVFTSSILKDERDLILAIPSSTVRGKVVITDQEVRLRNLAVALGRSNLGVQAALGFTSPYRWWLRASTPSSAVFHVEDVGRIAGLHLGGVGSVSAHIQGTYGDPGLEGQVDLQDFELGQISFGHVRGTLRWRGLAIDLPRVQGQRGRSTYELTDGQVSFRDGVTFTGTARFDPLQISEGVEMFGIGGAARNAEAEARGQALIRYRARGNRLHVDATGALAGTTYSGQLFGNGAVDVTYDTGDIALHELVLRRDGASSRVAGTVGRNGSLDLDVRFSDLPLGAIDPLPEVVRAIGGTTRGAGRVQGTLEFPRATGWVEASPLVHRGTRFGPSRLRFALDGDELRIEGGVGGRLLRLEEMTLGLSAPYPLWVRGRIDGLNVAELLGPDVLPFGIRIDASLDAGVDVGRLLEGPRDTTTRSVHGAVTIWGASQHDLGLSGWVGLESVEMTHPALVVRNEQPVRLDLDHDRVAFRRASPFTVHSTALDQSTSIDVSGWASLERLGLELEGDLDLAFVPAVLDQVSELSGRATVDCQVSGAPREPELMGEASVDIARLVLEGLEDVPATDVAGRLRFSRDVILLEDVTARVLGGDIVGGGRVVLSGFSLASYHLQSAFRDATLSFGERSSAVINGTVTLDSPNEEGELPLAGGRIEVVRLRYGEPIELATDLDELSRTRRTEVRTYDRARDSIRLDLQLTGSDNLLIANNLARAEVVIDDSAQPFRLVGTNQYQAALGTVQIVPHGSLTFRDTVFDIDRAVLEFTDPFELDPAIDFVATAARRDWVVTLRITGTFGEPRISLSSDPALAEADITLLLTVGLTREETEQMGYLSAASGAIPELLWSLSGVDEEVNRLLTLNGEQPVFDEFRITTDYSRRTGRTEPRIRVGRRLRESIRIGASAGLSEARDFEANLELLMSDNLSIEAVYENDSDFNLGNIGGDLRWRLEF
jgi:translocation and assembly module TamB